MERETERIIKTYLNDYSLDEESIKAIFGMLDIKADINKYKMETEKGVKYHIRNIFTFSLFFKFISNFTVFSGNSA